MSFFILKFYLIISLVGSGVVIGVVFGGLERIINSSNNHEIKLLFKAIIKRDTKFFTHHPVGRRAVRVFDDVLLAVTVTGVNLLALSLIRAYLEMFLKSCML